MTETTPSGSVDTNRLPDAGAGFVWEDHRGSAGRPFPVLRPDAADVRAVFTTRLGGTSSPPVDSLNLSFIQEREHVGFYDEEHVLANREIAGRVLGWGEKWSRIKQVHGGEVVRATSPSRRKEADGVWTDLPDRLIAILVADCVPVLLAASRRVGAAHAGWRGLVAGVVERTAEAMEADRAWVGPAIGPCCYEVGEEVIQAFRERFGSDPVPDACHVDLWSASEIALRRVGIADVWTARLCTSCHPELFYSHRRDRGRTGRQALIARLDV